MDVVVVKVNGIAAADADAVAAAGTDLRILDRNVSGIGDGNAVAGGGRNLEAGDDGAVLPVDGDGP